MSMFPVAPEPSPTPSMRYPANHRIYMSMIVLSLVPSSCSGQQRVCKRGMSSLLDSRTAKYLAVVFSDVQAASAARMAARSLRCPHQAYCSHDAQPSRSFQVGFTSQHFEYGKSLAFR
ncbi:hypothetical protein FA15DRAFT_395949 [Coprinopsis marcescibilis]|uniref:Uncharacterized protein n=1 Tax=Coprinopsis marcescibilis TaxID=230819 RepID=A0A5C3L9W1_COPMA|nr:hypothetical protein FA15DRAFT_395949 [Coprinopsis marcescibilis]